MKALELVSDFTYIPEAYGNRDDDTPMELTIHLLTAKEDMECIVDGGRDEVKFIQLAVAEIKNPWPIKVDGAPERDLTAEDIATVAGLKPLWSEVLAEYVERTSLDAKN